MAADVKDVSLKWAMLALSRDFFTDGDDIPATLGRVTAAAVDLVKGVDDADVMLIQDEEFQSALATRDVIGQAKGIVMNRFSVDAVRDSS